MVQSKRSNIERIFVLFIIILLFLGSMNNLQSFAKNIGFFSLLASLVLGGGVFLLYCIVRKEIYKEQYIILISSLPFIGVYLIGVFIYSSGIVTFLQLILLILFMLMFSLVKWSKDNFTILGICASSFILFQFLIWASRGFPALFTSIYDASNLVGAYMLYCIFILILVRHVVKNKWIYTLFIILGFFILLGTGTRSALLSLGIFLVVYFIWKFISKNKILFMSFYFFVLIAILSLILVYPKLPQFPFYEVLENWMLANTGKSVMSGRAEIWTVLLELIENRPWLGYGTGIQNNLFSSIEQSSHNLYLQILVQNGFLGLIGFLILITSIWFVFWKGRLLKGVRIVGAIFISILVYQSFEINFTQTILSLGAIQWAILGIGISYCIYQLPTAEE